MERLVQEGGRSLWYIDWPLRRRDWVLRKLWQRGPCPIKVEDQISYRTPETATFRRTVEYYLYSYLQLVYCRISGIEIYISLLTDVITDFTEANAFLLSSCSKQQYAVSDFRAPGLARLILDVHFEWWEYSLTTHARGIKIYRVVHIPKLRIQVEGVGAMRTKTTDQAARLHHACIN